MKNRLIQILAVCGVLASTSAVFGALEVTSQVSANINGGAPQYSGRVNDVVALTQSGVDQTVVLSFINASPGPFQPSADEIIKLRDAGVSSQVITAMLQRGGQLRDQAFAAASQAQNSYASYAQQAPAPVYAQPAQMAAQPAPYVDPTYGNDYSAPSSVVYVGGGYSYPNYYYSSYPYYYPGFYPRFGFNFGPRFGSGFRVGFPGIGFRGGFGGGFHGGFGGGGGFHGGGGGGFHGGGGGHGGGHR